MRIRLDCCLFGVKRDSLTRLYVYTSTLHKGLYCMYCRQILFHDTIKWNHPEAWQILWGYPFKLMVGLLTETNAPGREFLQMESPASEGNNNTEVSASLGY